MRRLKIGAARRLALAAQGFNAPMPANGINAGHFRRLMGRMGVLQLDSVNVVARSHYLPVYARLGPYPMASLDAYAYQQGKLFEYWGHEASLIPIDRLPLFRHRMAQDWRWASLERLWQDDPDYIESVYHQVEKRGPIAVGDLTDPGARSGPWWGYAKGKIALEHLFMVGRVAVATRQNFTRRYDIAERVWNPRFAAMPEVDKETAHRELVLLGAKHLGVGTAADIADYYRIPNKAAWAALGGLLQSGALQEVSVEGWTKSGYIHPDAVIPRSIGSSAVLSPFDPVVWYRPRAERLFGFHYRIEIYTPQPKRIYGYYVMPFLHRGELVARVDLKADRSRGALLAKGAFSEDGHRPEVVAPALASELERFAFWLGLGSIEIGDRGDLAAPLSRQLS